MAVFNPTTGTELWTSDGTAAGTRLVRDLWPGPAEALPNALLPLGDGRVVFSANDGESGFEPWVSDGTADGTLRIDDLASGFASSGPSEPTRVGDRIAFSADDGVHGRELFAVLLAALPTTQPSGCRPDRLCLHDGRFEVGVVWRDFQGESGPGRVVPGLDSTDSGLFWFFQPANYEFLVKVLDGCGVNGHFWVLAAATTNVEYTLTVADTTTGIAAIYSNALGRSSPAIIDVEALADCP
ncbi:MAG: hypothetical protein HC897_03585 [Thermoanaerobaculia bacterium]|nr:hypothetical protein [Thermoanaerobaculia bacterium]